MTGRIKNGRLVITTSAPVKRGPSSIHLGSPESAWDAKRFRAYVEMMHKPGCRSGACGGCA